MFSEIETDEYRRGFLPNKPAHRLITVVARNVRSIRVASARAAFRFHFHSSRVYAPLDGNAKFISTSLCYAPRNKVDVGGTSSFDISET